MQLALTPEVLVPVGAGAVLLLLALVAVLVVRRRRRRRAQARTTVADAVRDAAGPDAPTEDAPAENLPAENLRADDLPADNPPAADAPAGGEPAGSAAVRPHSDPAERVGSGRTVAAAVAQALAVREARVRVAASSPEDRAGDDGSTPAEAPQTAVPAPGGPAADGSAPAVPVPARADGSAPDAPDAPDGGGWQEPAAAPRGRGDARDRLLAVLLDDPVRAVGAAVELEACRRQLDRLTDAVRHERHVLGSVLARLAEAGLAPDQLARLSGLSDEELRSLLPGRVDA
jgi:hypothetical protein